MPAEPAHDLAHGARMQLGLADARPARRFPVLGALARHHRLERCEIVADNGILFTTYSTLRGGQQAQGGGAKAGRSRLDQIVEWLGQ